ncbi:MAG: metallophosphoesterase family protein, partial [Bacteroidota bacterium]
QESPERFDLIVVGHSHKPALSEEAGYRILNPGSAGRRRFSLPISLAILDIQEDQATISFINLLDDRPLP